MAIAGAQACSFYDPATGTVVQINSISQGSSFGINDIYHTDLDRGRRKIGEEFYLEIGTYQTEGSEQLMKWSRDNTPLNFVLAGNQKNILIYEDRPITIERPVNFSSRGRNQMIISMSGDSERLSCWEGMNLMNGFVLANGFEFGWSDDNDNGSANGYDIRSTNSLAYFEDEEQYWYSVAGNDGIVLPSQDIAINPQNIRFQWQLAFPISGIKLSFSTNVVFVPFECSSIISTFPFGSITTLNQQNITITEPGRYIHTYVTPGGTYGIHLRPLTRLFSGDSGEFRISLPALRTDGLSIYTE